MRVRNTGFHSSRLLKSVIALLGFAAYLGANRTRPASIRKDMHTGRVFYFGPFACKHSSA